MKIIHDKEKQFYLSEAILYIDEVFKHESGLYYDDEALIRDYNSKEYYHISSGASKIVIIFEDKNWVIKLPFEGDIITDYECIKSSDIECPQSLEEERDCEYCEYYNGYTHYQKFTGANNSLLKIENSSDYCELESKLWGATVDNNLEDLFLCTMKIGEYNNIPIYIQEKADIVGCFGDVKVSDESKKKYVQSFSSQSHQFNFYDDTFGAILLEYYGEEKLNKFFSFIDNYNIGDLHSGNFGFQNGRPVFIDYSGFRC